jgi:hypothetical protein
VLTPSLVVWPAQGMPRPVSTAPLSFLQGMVPHRIRTHGLVELPSWLMAPGTETGGQVHERWTE